MVRDEKLIREVPVSSFIDLIFSKMHQFEAAIFLYQSSLKRKNLMKLKDTQLFRLIIKLTKFYNVPKACTRWKTKRGIGVIFLAIYFTMPFAVPKDGTR